MATIDLTGFTMNPKETTDFRKMVNERTFERPELKAVHTVITGVKMKEQIAIASQLGLSGKLANGCNAVSSGAGSVLTQKYFEPASIEDTLDTCIKAQDSLFKPYFDKITRYRETYKMDGTDEELFILALVEEAIYATIWRAIWFGDKTVANATSSAAGLIPVSPTNTWAFNYIDGLWKQAFTAVSGGTLTRVTITENTPTGSPKAISAMTSTNAEAYLQKVYDAADPRLRNDENAQFLVDGQTFAAYVKFLTEKGAHYDMDYIRDGVQSVRFMGHNVVNMETIWDVNNTFFEDNTVNKLANLPYRIFFAAPANIPVATLSEEDFGEIESWYDRGDKTNHTRFGFTLDAKLVDNSLAVVAY
jgi:hypothetical protein